MTSKNDQELFWKVKYSKNYIQKNTNFNKKLLIEGWNKMLKSIDSPKTILEFGPNVGRNIEALNQIFPQADKTAVEISVDACAILNKKFENLNVINASILDSKISTNHSDLTFTVAVLTHIHPTNLLENLKKIISSSKRYILIAEYFNRTPVSIPYQGENDMLFKRDYGKYVLENFGSELTLLDYGFLWGHIYDDGGFDDDTWWLFEKK